MNVPCVICGKPSFMEGLCSECWLKKQKLFEIRDFTVTVCECGSHLCHGNWETIESIEEAVEKDIKEHIKSDNRIKKIECNIKIVGSNASASVKCSGLIPPCKEAKTETREVSILVKKSKCEECQKEAASYYEAVIQLRVDPLLERIMKWGGDDIIGAKKVNGGFDIFFKSNDKARIIADRLRKNDYIITKSVVYLAQKNNKKIYRKYYSVKNTASE